MAEKYQYYITGDDAETYMWGSRWQAQTFTPAIAHKITSVKLKLWREWATGPFVVSIRETDEDGIPIGEDLCSGSIDAENITDTGPGQWYEITLGEGCILDADTQYAIVARAPENPMGNQILWRYDATDPTYERGYRLNSDNSGTSWSQQLIHDFLFEEWGEPAVVAPTVTVQPTSDIKATTATANGTITDNGGEDCNNRGIVYGKTSKPDPGNVASEDSGYDDYEGQTDTFEIGAFTRCLCGLDPETEYYIRAHAHNSAGYGYSDEISFITKAIAPGRSFGYVFG